tara:strand:+ start:4506 stop:5474 length:969 start_codon:yes stop_codon:yes gene_type:complete
MPKVSIIIPVYNVEKYLKRCLESVCNQTLQDIEIICVNDFSPDNSMDILNIYANNDKRIKIIDFKENKGVAVARNSGMDIARGQYLAFLDSDDWVDLDYYEKLYNIAEQNDSDLAIANIKELRNGELKSFSFLDKIKQNKHHFMGLFVLGLYRRDLLSCHGVRFIEGITYGEDRLLPIVSSISANNICFVEDTFYNYDKSSEVSVTMKVKYSDKNIRDFFTSTNQVFKFLEKFNLSQEVYYIYVKDFLEQAYDILRSLDDNEVDIYKEELLNLYSMVSVNYPLPSFFEKLKSLYENSEYDRVIFEVTKKRQLDKLRDNMKKR